MNIRKPFNLQEWIAENKHLLKPPVANKNIYPSDHEHYHLSEIFVNMEVAYYIDVIKKAKEIHVIDSCFSCIVHPLHKTNKLDECDVVEIYSR